MKYSFTIYGKPTGKVNMKPYRRGEFITLVSPANNKNYMSMVQDAWFKGNFERIEDDTPIKMVIHAYFQIPKASKKKTALMLLDFIRPKIKPDCDNISKIICDSLNGIAFRDDSAIVSLNVEKLYTDKEPRVEVTIYSYTEGEEPICQTL